MLKDEENARPVRDLKERSKRYSLEIIRMVTSLPRDRVADVLGRQVLRSATSVGANYREANRVRSKAEFIAKVGDCLREAEEPEYWLELLADSGTVPAANIARFLHETRELLAKFRNSHDPRIAMIATGTYIKPLEIVFFMRSVKPRGFFE